MADQPAAAKGFAITRSTNPPPEETPMPNTTDYVNPATDRWNKLRAAVEALAFAGVNLTDTSQAVRALEDALADQGLQLLPYAPGYGRWRVLVDGEPAPGLYSRNGHPSGVLDADEAAEAFLYAAKRAEDNRESHAISVRPATDRELVGGLFGDRSVDPEANGG